MKKWYFLIVTIIVFYILASIKKKQKAKKDGIVKRIDTFINLVFWILLIAYSLTFIYWLYKALF